ncbi:hypothetical protein [Amycolatopsis anabasis]|uniref:hypothetical protein n=1 Tax=Amycolatopsis anabasis TaxID=1840409 RepID=UPI00131E1171|nr:hypothetical protein [Amycolatopsis anabasis]
MSRWFTFSIKVANPERVTVANSDGVLWRSVLDNSVFNDAGLTEAISSYLSTEEGTTAGHQALLRFYDEMTKERARRDQAARRGIWTSDAEAGYRTRNTALANWTLRLGPPPGVAVRIFGDQ